MKKYVWFTVIFIVAFAGLQQFSGMVLMWLYTPDVASAWFETSGAIYANDRVNLALPFVVALLSLGTAFAMTKLFSKRLGNY